MADFSCLVVEDSPMMRQLLVFALARVKRVSVTEAEDGRLSMRVRPLPVGGGRLHQVMLPWPGSLEIALRAAEFAALSDESRRPGKYYLGHRLPAAFAEARIEPLGFRTQCIDRQTPLDDDLAERLPDETSDIVDALDHDLPDDRLRLIFTCCHPALPPATRVAMTLREICGLTPEEERLAHDARFATVWLGPRTLRADTAPLALLSFVATLAACKYHENRRPFQ